MSPWGVYGQGGYGQGGYFSYAKLRTSAEDWQYPGSVEVTAGPTGEVLTAAEFGVYTGGLVLTGDAAQSAQIASVIGTATDLVEEWLGYSFRARTVRLADVEVEWDGGALWLIWGVPVSNVRVTDEDGDTVSADDWTVKRRYRLVDFIEFDNAGTYTVTYDVGGSTVPAAVKVVVSRVAASLWHKRFADEAVKLREDVEQLLGHYNAAPAHWGQR